MIQNKIEKAANDYINSEEFPVIGYPHLAKQDFIKGAEWAKEIMNNWLKNKLTFPMTNEYFNKYNSDIFVDLDKLFN